MTDQPATNNGAYPYVDADGALVVVSNPGAPSRAYTVHDALGRIVQVNADGSHDPILMRDSNGAYYTISYSTGGLTAPASGSGAEWNNQTGNAGYDDQVT